MRSGALSAGSPPRWCKQQGKKRFRVSGVRIQKKPIGWDAGKLYELIADSS
jgi:hypothetical protein